MAGRKGSKTPLSEKIFVVDKDNDDLWGTAAKITREKWEELQRYSITRRRDTGRVEYVGSCYCFSGQSHLMRNGVMQVGFGRTGQTPSIRMIRLYAENRKGRMQKLEEEMQSV